MVVLYHHFSIIGVETFEDIAGYGCVNPFHWLFEYIYALIKTDGNIPYLLVLPYEPSI